MYRKSVSILAGILLLSCSQSYQDKGRVTTLAVYSVKIENNEPVKDQPLYKEAFEYNNKGEITQHFQYDANGALKSREIYPLEYAEGDTIKTSFYDSNNVLQSNYVKILNEQGLKKEVRAYEAESNALLRLERYEYDANENLASKKVYTADDVLYRHQKFTYDKYGNEKGITIYNEENEIIFNESYKITTYDGNKMWTEKWGYTGGEPKSFRKRELEYD